MKLSFRNPPDPDVSFDFEAMDAAAAAAAAAEGLEEAPAESAPLLPPSMMGEDDPEAPHKAQSQRFHVHARTMSADSDEGDALAQAVVPRVVGVLVDSKTQPSAFHASPWTVASEPGVTPRAGPSSMGSTTSRATVGSLASLDIHDADAAEIEATTRAIGVGLDAGEVCRVLACLARPLTVAGCVGQ